MSNRKIIREVSTQEGYALWAASYDQEDNALIVLEETQIDALLAQISFSHVLDVGSGTGRYALKLARRGAQVTALDQSPEMLAIARQTAQDEELAIDFQLGSLEERLPFADQQFDFVVCALMLCHVTDLTAAVRELARVIRPGGYLLVTDFHPGSVEFGWRTQFNREQVKFLLPNMLHSRADYLETLSATGLKILHTLDLRIRDLPVDYVLSPLLQEHLDLLFSLIILTQKEA